MIDNNWDPISFGYDAHDLVVVQNYNCIHEGIHHHVVNLAYRYMNTWYTCVCNITYWNFSSIMEYVVSVLLSIRSYALQYVHLDCAKFWSWRPTSFRLKISSQCLLTNWIPHPQFTSTFKFEKKVKRLIHLYNVAHENLSMQHASLKLGKW